MKTLITMLLLVTFLSGCGEANIESDCTSNGYGRVECSFQNLGTSKGSVCVTPYFERVGAMENFKRSYTGYKRIIAQGSVCSGLVEPNDVIERSKSLGFQVDDCDRSYCQTPDPSDFCSKSFGSWSAGCIFGTIVTSN